LEKHIFEGDFSITTKTVWNSTAKVYKLTWVHYKSAIIPWKIEFVEWTRVDKWNWFYEAKVKAFSQEKYNMQKTDPSIPEASKWRTKKEDASTFFPDSRSKEKIKDEIANAYTNISDVTKTVNWKTYTWKVWYLQDGTPIEFKLNTDGSISSAYANFIFN
jgi:hypothetical protein